jgi:hypothetical protein
MIAGLGARVHLFARPEVRERMATLWRDVLDCAVRELDFGLPHPILLVSFPDGSAFSVEFSDSAPQVSDEPPDYANVRKGAWIEFRTDDLAGTNARLDNAGVPSFSHPASPHRYFVDPCGQVFRVLDLNYSGP